jgi:Bifunctional DNA primase/polymerase, N-terminal
VSAFAIAALALAAQGWHVFPIRPRAKVPLTAHGFHDATCEREQVKRWWRATPNANIGIACGASGLLVVDLDGEPAAAAWADLAASNGGHRPTLVAATGKPGGRHIFFMASGLPNTAGKLGAGIDTRGEGGYVVAVPSRHPSGHRYHWLETAASEPAPAPRWLVELLEAKESPPAVGEWRSLLPGVWATPYGEGALAGLCDEMLLAREGQRNELLVRLAYRAGRLVAAGELDDAIAERALVDAACAVGLPLGEATHTYKSGAAAGENAGPAAVRLGDWRTTR